jgi:hypothetical protein
MDAPDDDGWQWQAELEEQQQIELNERTERTGESNGNRNLHSRSIGHWQEHVNAQSRSFIDPFDTGS